MAFDVRFKLTDGMGRVISRTWSNNSALIADVLADVVILWPLWKAITKGGLEEIIIHQVSQAVTEVADAVSNRDTGMVITLKTSGVDDYGMRLPMPIEALKLAGGAVDTANAALLAFLAEFDVAKNWRVNLANPVSFVSIVKGTIDK
ncbi:MAG: hypothetical protein KAV87_57605 [Desulfobacteraceae bacterium]|nr:hypothetical protein [Desulfobacteraceae bacterium]